jgi:hypothetical protein
LFLAASYGGAVDQPAFSARGRLLFSEKFGGPTLAPGWQGKLGTWELQSGTVKISERTEDKHAAVRRYPLQYHDAIFEFSFQFDGARAINLSINDKRGHVCRLVISPRTMVLQTDKPNLQSELKPVKLASLDTPVAPNEWHKVVVEVRGKRMIAQLDGAKTIAGESPLVDVDKADFGFPVSGVSALLKDVSVYEIQAK